MKSLYTLALVAVLALSVGAQAKTKTTSADSQAKKKAQATQQAKSPYSAPRDWNYIELNSGGN